MAKEAKIEVDGKVIDVIKDEYKVELENGFVVTAHVSGKIRMNMSLCFRNILFNFSFSSIISHNLPPTYLLFSY